MITEAGKPLLKAQDLQTGTKESRWHTFSLSLKAWNKARHSVSPGPSSKAPNPGKMRLSAPFQGPENTEVPAP